MTVPTTDQPKRRLYWLLADAALSVQLFAALSGITLEHILVELREARAEAEEAMRNGDREAADNVEAANALLFILCQEMGTREAEAVRAIAELNAAPEVT